MSNLLLPFLLLTLLLSLIITMIGEMSFRGENVDIESQYYDQNGDHIYYERSLIEKKEIKKRFPHIKNLRSFSRLFGVYKADGCTCQ